MRAWACVLAMLEDEPACVLVTVVAVEGSAPREAGARMVVDAGRRFHGTIGGGMLEYQTIEAAAANARAVQDGFRLERMSLGPDLGQCCGGRITLALETISRKRRAEVDRLARLEADGLFVTSMSIPENDAPSRRVVSDERCQLQDGARVLLKENTLYERFGNETTPVMLFGAGHVGKALVLALAPLPFSVIWIDNRAEVFPARVPANVRTVLATDPLHDAASTPAGADVLVMTHDHGLDLAIADVALRCRGIAGVGMIGSETKAARMRSRLLSAGHDAGLLDAAFRCPVGISGIASKLPAAIAASIAAELIMRRDHRSCVHKKRRTGLAGAVDAIG
ncbi:xanthine dehydrogenase accessory protein XdhC [Stappia sp. ES.058]|uniref:xanthine dehydrogenase accessory protein XdhC n=1 Tax=Stappia sp. ES.058 TaxID=1881061 RepID=UPI00087B45E7|nr:xanthine dehydrogenase accessory protein XdhC [Stappia sp. ES.058]SDU09528.1 molybdenum cofactor sulfurylase [Stappia sp. ES.058]